jgi:hypothetical protein
MKNNRGIYYLGLSLLLWVAVGCRRDNHGLVRPRELRANADPKVVYFGKDGEFYHFVSTADVFFGIRIGPAYELYKWEIKDLDSFLPHMARNEFQVLRESSSEWSEPQWRSYGTNRFYGIVRLDEKFEVWTGYIVIRKYACQYQICFPRSESYRKVRQSMFDFTAGLPKTLPKEVIGPKSR